MPAPTPKPDGQADPKWLPKAGKVGGEIWYKPDDVVEKRPSPTQQQASPDPPASDAPPNGQVAPKGDPQVKQHCFKNADEVTICVTDKTSYHNETKVYEANGVSDTHNDHNSSKAQNIAGIVPGRNITSAAQAQGAAAGRPGETKFDSHSFNEDGGFRDTHREDPSAANGNTFEFEDHKEDSTRNGKDGQVHSSGPDGERTDAKGHFASETHQGVDVKEKNGATDSTHKETSGTEFNGMFQKHHAGPDNSDRHDSKVTNSGYIDSQHQKEEHTDADLHTLHEESSGKGAWSWNVVGNHALGDLAQESQNRPKPGEIAPGSKADWSQTLPKRDVDSPDVHIEVHQSTPEKLDADRVDYPEDLQQIPAGAKRCKCGSWSGKCSVRQRYRNNGVNKPRLQGQLLAAEHKAIGPRDEGNDSNDGYHKPTAEELEAGRKAAIGVKKGGSIDRVQKAGHKIVIPGMDGKGFPAPSLADVVENVKKEQENPVVKLSDEEMEAATRRASQQDEVHAEAGMDDYSQWDAVKLDGHALADATKADSGDDEDHLQQLSRRSASIDPAEFVAKLDHANIPLSPAQYGEVRTIAAGIARADRKRGPDQLSQATLGVAVVIMVCFLVFLTWGTVHMMKGRKARKQRERAAGRVIELTNVDVEVGKPADAVRGRAERR